MKATGIVRRMDDLGRVVIPKEIRRTLNIKDGDPIEIFTDEGGVIILKKYTCYNKCIFCDNITEGDFMDKPVCNECKTKLAIK